MQRRDREAIDLARLRACADEWDDEGDGACGPHPGLSSGSSAT